MNLEEKTVTVSYNPLQVSPGDLRDHLDDMGYELPSEVMLNIGGMTCHTCVDKIEKFIPTEVEGVVKIKVGTVRNPLVLWTDGKLVHLISR